MIYDYITKRKSIRKYKEEKINDIVLDNIHQFFKEINPLFPNIKTEIKIFTKDSIKSSLLKAPYYLCIYSEDKDGYLLNSGFIMEQLDLYLSSIGLGGCYLGMGGPTKDNVDLNGLKFVIMLAFGIPDEKLYRDNIQEYKRKKVDLISNIDNELIQNVRLAPSAINSQPWYFNQCDDSIDIYLNINTVLGVILNKKNDIDIGISLCYLYLYTTKINKKIKFISEKKDLLKYKYIISAKIS